MLVTGVLPCTSSPPSAHAQGVNKIGEKAGESKCALVFGQMNEPPGARARVALTGLTIAEYFRDYEGQDVLLFIDNIFRFTQVGGRLARAHAPSPVPECRHAASGGARALSCRPARDDDRHVFSAAVLPGKGAPDAVPSNAAVSPIRAMCWDKP